MIMKIIRKMVIAVLLMYFSFSALSQPSQATIEDKDLRSLSPLVEEVITRTPAFSGFSQLHCKLIGKKISITKKSIVYFLTTKNACGWGAALGPI